MTNSEIVIGTANVKLTVQEPGSQGGIDGLVDVSSSSPIDGSLLRYSTVRNRWENFGNLSVSDSGSLTIDTSSGDDITLYQSSGLIKGDSLDVNTGSINYFSAISLSSSQITTALITPQTARVTTLSSNQATLTSLKFEGSYSTETQTVVVHETPAYYSAMAINNADVGTFRCDTPQEFFNQRVGGFNAPWVADWTFYSRGSISTGTNNTEVDDNRSIMYTMCIENTTDSDIVKRMSIFKVDDDAFLFMDNNGPAVFSRTTTHTAPDNTNPIILNITITPGFHRLFFITFDTGGTHGFEMLGDIIGDGIRFIPPVIQDPYAAF